MKKILLMIIVAVMTAATFAAQCAATTKKGTQCKRQAAAGSSYCWQHGGKAKRATATPATTPENLTQCKAITKEGTQCKRNASYGSNYCWQHQGNEMEKPASTVETSTKEEPAASARPPVAADGMCTAITKSGKRCSRKATAGSNKCWQHAQ